MTSRPTDPTVQLKRQQAEPIRDPDRPLFAAKANPDAARDRIRLLAEGALNRSTTRHPTGATS